MGDPKNPRKNWRKPKRPLNYDLLNEELYVLGTFGLKNKHLSVAEVYEALGHKQQNLFCPFPNDCHGGAECIEKELEAELTGKMNDLFAKTIIT